MIRISTSALSNQVISNALSVKTRYATTLVQESSELKAQTYAGLGGRAAKHLSNTENALALNETWTANAKTAAARVTQMTTQVEAMISLVSGLRTTLSSFTATSTSTSSELSTTGQGVLEDLANAMNSQLDGRYLFSGSDTDTAPVSITNPPYAPATTPSTADTSYYQGDTVTSTVRVSETQMIDYGVTADTSAFEKALRAANLVANISGTPPDSSTITEALDLAKDALTELTSLEGKLGTISKRLETTQEQSTAMQEILSNAISDDKLVDITEVAARLSSQEAVLEASYSAVAKVMGLKLTDYL